MINKICQMFCKHRYELIRDVKIGNYNGAEDMEKVVPNEYVKIYRCKKCGHIQRVSSKVIDIPLEVLKWTLVAFWVVMAVIVIIKVAIRK